MQKKKRDKFLRSKYFELFEPNSGNSVNICELFMFIIWWGVAIVITRPGCQKRNLATPQYALVIYNYYYYYA
jgi:hypothetical protein